MRKKSGFTLIELLIVVAIIAILAAIAVPNFLEAQTRAKVARVKNDLRTQSTALQAYYIDYNKYTRDSDSDLDREYAAQFELKANGACQLTTPIAYMTGLLKDPFTGANRDVTGGTADGYRIGSGTWSYPAGNATPPDHQDGNAVFTANGSAAAFITLSPGPDRKRNRMGYKCFPYRSTSGSETSFYQDYDPTNGTVSGGDIMRFGGSFMTGTWNRNSATNGPAGPEAL